MSGHVGGRRTRLWRRGRDAASDASQTGLPPRAQGAGRFEESPNPEPSGCLDAAQTEGPSRARGTGHFQTPPPHAELDATDPALITFTSGTAGEPKAVVHGQRYLYGQRVQAEHWLGAEQGELVWCTAASGWSKSARNVFMAPWLMGAPALLHDARFDPHERLDLIEREQVSVLCMAPTEYRVIAKRAELRALAEPARGWSQPARRSTPRC